MLCERCNKNQANVLYTEIINGIKKETRICDECANTSPTFQMDYPMFGSEHPIGGLLSNLLQGYTNVGHSIQGSPINDLRCDNCGLTYREFAQKGRFGCANCYNSFQEELDKSLRGIQGAEVHTGKTPGGKVQTMSEIEKLSKQLQEAIKKEEYEEAARLRDLIREKEKEDNSNG